MVTNIRDLVKLIVDQTNLYAQQNGREFRTDEKKMLAFLGINCIMSINQLPTIQSYWECGQFIGNKGIRNVLTRARFKDILQNIHFADNSKNDKSDKGYRIRPVIDHFNKAFASAVSNDACQSIDEHMVKFKGRSSMKQYIKKKPIKWGFKFWYRCASATGYLYQLDLYLGKKENVETNFGKGVVLKMSEVLENTYCTVYFDNFFNSPLLISKLFEKGIYGIENSANQSEGNAEFDARLPNEKGRHTISVLL